ncbi:MAG TPA: AarF/UbiB family protein [Kofleriaceae bacterium]|jgi:ubiquinone biosynthesis protein|nr:AarF/UbiB family protein [Kofleriaceae bacterium]
MRTLRFVRRGFLVGLLLLVSGIIWLAGWLGLLLSFRGKAARQTWFATRFAQVLISLGATFVKVGQIMSTRPDLFPPHIIRALTRLQDNVGAFPWRDVERTLVADFGKSPTELFASFDRTPVASASVAQVHRATLPSGEEVAVKIRRPGLDDLVGFDLSIMRLVARITAIIPSVRLLAPVESVDEFGRAIRAQIDLRIEADNNRRFTLNFKSESDIGFPLLYPALCSRHVLTMKFIRGAKVLDAPAQQGVDATRLAKIGFRTLLKMVFADGFVHADLHPGNIFVDDQGKVIILDLGLTAELDDAARRAFALFFASWASRNGKTMAKLMSDLSPSSKVADYDAYEREVDEFVARYHGKALGEVQVSTVAFDMFNILRRHRVRVNPVYTMCNVAIAVTEGIGKQLDPTLDLVQEALPFFATIRDAGRL